MGKVKRYKITQHGRETVAKTAAKGMVESRNITHKIRKDFVHFLSNLDFNLKAMKNWKQGSDKSLWLYCEEQISTLRDKAGDNDRR